MNTLNILIVTFLILIGLMIYMSRSLYQLKKTAKNEKSSLTDERYFELKYQHQLFISVGAIIVFLVSFFGWNSMEGIEKDVNEKLKSVKEMETKQNQLSTRFNLLDNSINLKQKVANDSINSFYGKLEKNRTLLNSLVGKAKMRVDSIDHDVENLSNIIAENPSIYVVTKQFIGGWNDEDFVADTIHFEDCIAFKNRLPKFDNPPFVLPISPSVVQDFVNPVTKDFFVYHRFTMFGDVDTVHVNFLILNFLNSVSKKSE